jgi:hypothetical protein
LEDVAGTDRILVTAGKHFLPGTAGVKDGEGCSGEGLNRVFGEGSFDGEGDLNAALRLTRD